MAADHWARWCCVYICSSHFAFPFTAANKNTCIGYCHLRRTLTHTHTTPATHSTYAPKFDHTLNTAVIFSEGRRYSSSFPRGWAVVSYCLCNFVCLGTYCKLKEMAIDKDVLFKERQHCFAHNGNRMIANAGIVKTKTIYDTWIILLKPSFSSNFPHGTFLSVVLKHHWRCQ